MYLGQLPLLHLQHCALDADAARQSPCWPLQHCLLDRRALELDGPASDAAQNLLLQNNILYAEACKEHMH